MKSIVLGAVVALGALAFGTPAAEAQCFGGGGFGSGAGFGASVRDFLFGQRQPAFVLPQQQFPFQSPFGFNQPVVVIQRDRPGLFDFLLRRQFQRDRQQFPRNRFRR